MFVYQGSEASKEGYNSYRGSDDQGNQPDLEYIGS